MKHLNLLLKNLFMLLLLVSIIESQESLQIKLRNTAVNTVTPFDSTIALSLGTENDYATYFLMEKSVFSSINAFSLRFNKNSAPNEADITFNARITLLNPGISGNDLINGLSPYIPLSSSFIKFKEIKRNQAQIKYYIDKKTLDESKDNYIILYIKLKSKQVVWLNPPSPIKEIDMTSVTKVKKVLIAGYYAPLFLKITVPVGSSALFVTDRYDYRVHSDSTIIYNKEYEISSTITLKAGTSIIEFDIPGHYLGVPNININIEKTQLKYESLTQIRQTNGKKSIECASNVDHYFIDNFGLNEPSPIDTKRIFIKQDKLVFTAYLKYVGVDDLPKNTDSTDNTISFTKWTPYTLQIHCNGSGTVEIVYGDKITESLSFNNIIEYPLVLSSSTNTIPLGSQVQGTNLKITSLSLLTNNINLTINGSNQILNKDKKEITIAINAVARSLPDVTITSTEESIINFSFSKTNLFTSILNSQNQIINKPYVLYELTDTTSPTVTIEVNNINYETINYSIYKGDNNSILSPTLSMTSNIMTLTNPCLGSSSDKCYIALNAPSAASNPYNLNILYKIEPDSKPFESDEADNGDVTNNDFEIVKNEDIPGEGPNLTALWVIMGIAGAVALVIGGWFIYNCLLAKGFFKHSNAVKPIEAKIPDTINTQKDTKINTKSSTRPAVGKEHTKYNSVASSNVIKVASSKKK